MKRIFLGAWVTLLSCTAICQENSSLYKGNNIIGLEQLNIGYANKSLSLRVLPSYSKMISNRLAIDSKFNLGLMSYNSGTNSTKGLNIGITPGIRYYFTNLDKRLVFYGTTSLSFGRVVYNDNSSMSNSNIWLWRSALGAEYFLGKNKRFSLFTDLGYQLDLNSGQTNTSGYSANFGLRFYLGKKKSN